MAVAAVELVFEAFVGVVGGFETASDFAVLATAADAFSFLSSASNNHLNSETCATVFKWKIQLSTSQIILWSLTPSC